MVVGEPRAMTAEAVRVDDGSRSDAAITMHQGCASNSCGVGTICWIADFLAEEVAPAGSVSKAACGW